MASTIDRVFENDIVRIATSRNGLAAVWHDAPTLETLKALERAGHALNRSHPDQVFLLNVLRSGKPAFSAEVRAETARQTRENPFGSIAGAHIVTAEGLAGTAARTFLSTTLLVGRPERPTKVFREIQEAAPWLLPHINGEGRPEWSAPDLVAFYEGVVTR